MSLDLYYIAAQIIGFIAAGFGIWGYLSTDDRRHKWIMIGQNLWLGLHFAMLGVWVACLLVLVTVVRNFLSLQFPVKKIAFVIIGVYMLIGVFAYQAWPDLLTTIAAVICTYAYFYLSKAKMRWVLVAGSLMWMIHNIAVGSIGPAIMEGCMTLAVLSAIVRIYFEEGGTWPKWIKRTPPPMH